MSLPFWNIPGEAKLFITGCDGLDMVADRVPEISSHNMNPGHTWSGIITSPG